MTEEKEVLEQNDQSEITADQKEEKPKKSRRRSRSSKANKLEEENKELKVQLDELKDKHMRLLPNSIISKKGISKNGLSL